MCKFNKNSVSCISKNKKCKAEFLGPISYDMSMRIEHFTLPTLTEPTEKRLRAWKTHVLLSFLDIFLSQNKAEVPYNLFILPITCFFFKWNLLGILVIL